MRKFIFALGLLSCTAFADVGIDTNDISEVIVRSTSVPATPILNAAFKIKHHGGPAYFVEGNLTCSERAAIHGGAPYQACEIEVDGKFARVAEPTDIIKKLKVFVPQKSHLSWDFVGTFKASSISREFPPYGADSKATVYFNHFHQ